MIALVVAIVTGLLALCGLWWIFTCMVRWGDPPALTISLAAQDMLAVAEKEIKRGSEHSKEWAAFGLAITETVVIHTAFIEPRVVDLVREELQKAGPPIGEPENRPGSYNG